MPLINFEINLILTWSANCVTASHAPSDQATTFAITDATLGNQSKVKIRLRNQYLGYLIDPSFREQIEIKYYHVMIDGKNVFDLLLKNDLRIYDNIQKITTSQRD